ncbi:AhpC/TSA family protein [Oceanispirochaeta crateris]|uniref:thioredoxin-dependent peroxiredoxin n=1 Tax=Oceanispirochaeta crateris TaxID=2518645 RepID=A0A5C1QI95_9SPIO|nr:peroxiredoxin-like family protein [Oceanispirochaeta crateris]QEN06720.1 AhpC/TSA family protein [Oceanispirochaeta crateris]
MEKNTENRLVDDLNKQKSEFASKAPADKKKIYGDGLQSLVDQHIAENALQLGDTAVDFTLKNATGSEVTLYEELKKGPVVLIWYRGGWCPYCNLTLRHMQASLSEIKKYGATLMALTPELPDKTMSTQEKHNLEFEVLSDNDNSIARKYKIFFKLTDAVAKVYEESFGLSQYNGNSKGELPLAVTYIIDSDKTIKYAFLDADYRNRAEPSDIVDFLKKNY